MNELVIIESTEISKIFSDGGIDPVIQKIKDEVTGIVPDMTTAGGRSQTASLAHKVAKSKTYLDGLGKNLVSGIKQQAKIVDVERKKMRDELDELKAKVRQPLTEWEEFERDRVAGHRKLLQNIVDAGTNCYNCKFDCELPSMEETLSALENMAIDESWEEFEGRAVLERNKSVILIKEAIDERQKYDEEQAELAELRAKQAERERKNREEALRREGEERAKRQAEAAAQESVRKAEMAAENERKAKILALRREQHAKANVESAARRERDRISREKAAEEAAAAKREADNEHRDNVLCSATSALMEAGLSNDNASRALRAIARGDVPFVQVHF